MKLEIKEETASSIHFIINDVDAATANALRRAMINGVSTFAIDKVNFYENTSAMFDEYIAHRIGLVPISTPKSHTEDEQVLFTLDAEGPKVVLSKELESRDKEIKVANGDIPLIKLDEGQKIRLDGTAIIGTSVKHTKFQACHVAFENKGKNSFEFNVESFGQMPPRQIVNNALEAIKKEIKAIEKEAKSL